MTFKVYCAIGQLKDTVRCNRGCSVEGEIIAGEARVDELILTGYSGEAYKVQGHGK